MFAAHCRPNFRKGASTTICARVAISKVHTKQITAKEVSEMWLDNFWRAMGMAL